MRRTCAFRRNWRTGREDEVDEEVGSRPRRGCRVHVLRGRGRALEAETDDSDDVERWGISTVTPSQQQQQLPATPSGGKTGQNTGKGNRGGQQRSSSGSVGLGRNYYLGPPVTGSGATSPNDSDNTYAEASLLAHGRYEHNNAEGTALGQNTRYDQGKYKFLEQRFSTKE